MEIKRYSLATGPIHVETCSIQLGMLLLSRLMLMEHDRRPKELDNLVVVIRSEPSARRIQLCLQVTPSICRRNLLSFREKMGTTWFEVRRSKVLGFHGCTKWSRLGCDEERKVFLFCELMSDSRLEEMTDSCFAVTSHHAQLIVGIIRIWSPYRWP